MKLLRDGSYEKKRKIKQTNKFLLIFDFTSINSYRTTRENITVLMNIMTRFIFNMQGEEHGSIVTAYAITRSIPRVAWLLWHCVIFKRLLITAKIKVSTGNSFYNFSTLIFHCNFIYTYIHMQYFFFTKLSNFLYKGCSIRSQPGQNFFLFLNRFISTVTLLQTFCYFVNS